MLPRPCLIAGLATELYWPVLGVTVFWSLLVVVVLPALATPARSNTVAPYLACVLSLRR